MASFASVSASLDRNATASGRTGSRLLLGHCRKGYAGAADQCGIEAMRPDQQLDQARIGFRGGKRVARKLLLNHVPQRLVDDRRVFARMGLPLVNVATGQEAIGI